VDGTQVDVDQGLVELEQRGWGALVDGSGADFYEQLMADDGFMLLPEVGLVDKAAAVEGLRGALPWSWFDLGDTRVVHAGDGVAVVVYTVSAQRDGQPVYQALMSSTYTRREGRWTLLLHQQTPLPTTSA
jgi:hypothetical protein